MNIIKTITNLITKNKMETLTITKGPKYIYDSELLATEVIKQIKDSLNTLASANNFYYVRRLKNNYDPVLDIYSQEKTNRNLYYKASYFGEYLNPERYKKIMNSLSKKGKKRVNKLLIKLGTQPSNMERLNKLWNRVELLGGNQYVFMVGNTQEDRISTKRKAYKEVIKYIKLDLVEELKRTKQEYIETKGDYFKSK